MNRWLAVIISVLMVGGGVAGLMKLGVKPEVKAKDESSDEVTLVKTEPAIEWTEGFDLVVDGEASSRRVVSIGTEVEGKILRRLKRSGNFVREGDLLYEVDSSRYALDVRRLDAQLRQADAELCAIDVEIKNTEALLELAEKDAAIQSRQVMRLTDLRAQQATDDVTLEAAQVRELTAQNTVQTLRNSIASFRQQEKTKTAAKDLVQAQLERAELDVERCQIKATVTGRIADDLVEEGDFVKQGQILVRISDNSQMEVKCFLKPDEALAILTQSGREDLEPIHEEVRVDDPVSFPRVPCVVSFEFGEYVFEWDGFIDRLEGTGIDRETRTVPCRVVVPQPNQLRLSESDDSKSKIEFKSLLSGMFVKVTMPMKTGPLVELPLSAIRQGSQVWVREDDELLVHRVKVVHVNGDRARIEEDPVAAGDRVVVSPLVSVKNNMKVAEDPGAGE